MNKKIYIFDFDDTIVNSLPLCFECFRIVFFTYNNQILRDSEIEKMFGSSEEVIIEKNIRNKNHIEEGKKLFYFLYEELHDNYIQKQTLNEFLELVTFLKRNKNPVCIFTGKGKKSLEISLNKLSLINVFDYIVTDDDVEWSKPNGEGIKRILSHYNSVPSDAVFIGDTDADILAARDAGVSSIGVNWYKKRNFLKSPDIISDSPLDLIYTNTEGSEDH